MKPHSFHPGATREYTEAAQHYAAIDPVLGVRFHQEMERLISEIRAQPERFRVIDPPIQRHFSHVFPYALLFVNQPDRIRILAVMHMAREPGYWKGRL